MFIQKLDYTADLDKMLQDFNNTVATVGWPEKRFEYQNRSYAANQIGLTYRPGSPQPWFDASGSLYDKEQQSFIGQESDFTEWNNVGSYTKSVIETLGEKFNTKFGRIRYMRLMPKTGLSVHPDFEQRYHFVLTTNKYAYFGDSTEDQDIKAKCYHVPSDGHFYKVDTTREHFVFNGGWEPRIHLVLCEV